MMEEFMRSWSAKCQKNPLLALVSIPLIIVFAVITAVKLFLRGDKRWKDCI